MNAVSNLVRARQTKTAPVIIRRGRHPKRLDMHWGLEPVPGEERSAILIRAEGRQFPEGERCLIPATALSVTDRQGGKWEATFQEGGEFFCFAGIWRPATATWPMAYAAITVPAYPDLAHLEDRHVAFVPKPRWVDWLGGGLTAEILRPLPKGSLRVQRVGRRGAIGDLFQ